MVEELSLLIRAIVGRAVGGAAQVCAHARSSRMPTALTFRGAPVPATRHLPSVKRTIIRIPQVSYYTLGATVAATSRKLCRNFLVALRPPRTLTRAVARVAAPTRKRGRHEALHFNVRFMAV